MNFMLMAGKSGHITDLFQDAEQWTRTYWSNQLDPPDYLSLHPQQIDVFHPMDDQRGIIRQVNGQLTWCHRPRRLAPECRK